MIPGKRIVADLVRRSLGLSAALVALGLAHAAPARAADYQVIHNFAGPVAGGSIPYGSLIQSGSTLYGTTSEGGSVGKGTVFQVGTDGTGFSLLHSFADGSDGRYPQGSLIQSGSTLYGMANNGGGAFKSGTVFQVGTDGSGFGVLHTFGGGSTDGALGPLVTSHPHESLIQSGSTLYGMTHNGGSANDGTIFKIGTDGAGFGLLHSFTGGSDGGHPIGSLIQSGSTFYGGGGGTVFKMDADGTGFSVLHTFPAFFGDGRGPSGSLIQSGSTLYGTTAWGGQAGDGGTIFKVETDGSGYSLSR